MKGEDQQENQYSRWVRNVEMSLLMEERLVDDVNGSSCGTSPSLPPAPTQSSSMPLPRNWNLPGTLPSCSPVSSPGFLQDV